MTFELEQTYLPVCPHCGKEERDAWEINFGASEEAEINCGYCGNPFHIYRNVSVSYTTKRLEKKP